MQKTRNHINKSTEKSVVQYCIQDFKIEDAPCLNLHRFEPINA